MKTSEKIIDYIQQNGQTTGVRLVDYLDITDRAVRKQLKTLLDSGKIIKVGKPPRVYYSLTPPPTSDEPDVYNLAVITKDVVEIIDNEFFYISSRGTVHEGWKGFLYWCRERKLDPRKTAERYKKTIDKYYSYKKDGLIDGMYKLNASFEEVALDRVFYIDFYSIEIFGKTKLGQLLLFAKQSQNRKLINEIVGIIEPVVLRVIDKYQIDGVGFIPPSVKRELQLMKAIQNKLNLNVRILSINKIRTTVTVPQKTLSKIEDRIINARETISLDDTGIYKNILLIDDALGSGATLNEVAKKIRNKKMCTGQIVGLVITGSFKGFEVISEV
ncbi:HTH domain-containing protein [Candidatus Saccharibacteria bacterium]|nr:HTH domain-containing protein [Candidatus Saccharibacteria bacterium]NCU41049.1 HTH domain-containing protein [Candidatus Saccharibacteria bacterium]